MKSQFEEMSQRANGTLDVDDYVERSQNYQPWLNFFTVVSAILIFLLTHWALSGANEYIAHRDGNPEFYLLPQTATWWLCAGVFGFILSFEFTLQTWALFRGHLVVELYNEWTTGQPKSYKGGEIYMDTRKFFRRLAVFIAFPTGLFTVLDVPSHASLGPRAIRDCGYAFSGCKDYPYAAARRMTAIRGFRTTNGELKRRAGILIDFSDGRRWSSAEWGDFKSSIDPALVELLLRKTNLPIGNADTEQDIPPLAAK